MTADAVRDDVELRLRMLPGVLAVGFEATRDGDVSVAITIAEGAAPLTVGEEAAAIVAAIPAAGLRITPARFPMSRPHVLRKRILAIDGVAHCDVALGPDQRIDGLRVDVCTIAAIVHVTDLVTAELGEDFADRRLHFELQFPTSRGAGRAPRTGGPVGPESRWDT